MLRQHCPDEHDERQWIVEDICTAAVHARISEAQSAGQTWLRSISAAMQPGQIGPLSFPIAAGRSAVASGSVIDPTLVYLLLAQARRGDQHANAIYIAAVAQDPSSWWRGITGFYLPFCSRCTPNLRDAVAPILDWLPQDASVHPRASLPEGVQPGPDWFDDRLLLGIHLTASVATAPWRLWDPGADGPPEGPALVRTGRLDASLDNLLLVTDAQRDLPALAGFLAAEPHPLDQRRIPVLTYRTGPTAGLLRLTGGRRSEPEGLGTRRLQLHLGVTRRRPPATWGTYVLRKGDRSQSGLSRDLRELVHRARRGTREAWLQLRYWPEGAGVLCWDDLIALDHLTRDDDRGSNALRRHRTRSADTDS